MSEKIVWNEDLIADYIQDRSTVDPIIDIYHQVYWVKMEVAIGLALDVLRGHQIPAVTLSPNWLDAPEWTNWAIVEMVLSIRYTQFNWLFLEHEPELRFNMWRFDGRTESGYIIHLPLGVDYRTVKCPRL